MSTSMRHDSWSLAPRLQDEINRLFGSVGQNGGSAAPTWSPAVDVHEHADRFELVLDLPGVEPQDVELTLDDSVLTLSGQRLEHVASAADGAAPVEKPQYRRTERGQGRFHRRFVLPDTVDGEKVKATGKNGVLTVTIPKQPKAQPRRIQIAA